MGEPPHLTPTFITTPKGEELVIMSRDLYDRMTDLAGERKLDAGRDADAAIAERARADWIAAGRPVVPISVVRRIRAGDSPLRAFRLHRGMGQPELAEKAGIAQGYLSEVERGLKAPNETVMGKLAAALDTHPTCLSVAAEP